MIKLILSLFTITSLYADPFYALFPDQYTLFTHQVQTTIKHAHTEIIVISNVLHNDNLRKSFIDITKHGVKVNLIVNSLTRDSLSLAQYDGITLYTYKVRPFTGSIIIIDSELGCILTSTLDEEKMLSDGSVATCTDNIQEISLLHASAMSIIKRSNSYLK
ncbi:MAG: hypothetical protein PHO27_04480 [Sulfuricurvum sp.]|nr:hypothetical protein [Sulfuricurvum sp.]